MHQQKALNKIGFWIYVFRFYYKRLLIYKTRN
jgi:hypothetical protein